MLQKKETFLDTKQPWNGSDSLSETKHSTPAQLVMDETCSQVG